MLAKYPMSADEPIYVLDESISIQEMIKIAATLNSYVPDLTISDVVEMHEKVGYYDWFEAQK